MKRALLLFTVFFICIYTSTAQGDWSVMNTSNSDIPSNDLVNFAMPDHECVFIGTPGGLVTPGKVYEYDGTAWTQIEWISGFNEIKRNSSGDIVIGNQSGVYHFDGENYILFNAENSGLTANYIQDIDVDEDGFEYACMSASGLIFVGGLAIFDGNDWNTYNSGNSPLPVNNMLAVMKSQSGPLWIGTSDGGLVRKSGDDWEIFNTDNSPIPGNKPICIAETTTGLLWLGFSNRSIATYDGTNWETIKDPSSRDFPDGDIIDIFVDASDNVWIAFANNGIGRFNGSEWTFYTSQNSGLPDNRVMGIGENGQGGIYMGTDGGGLAIFEPEYLAIADPEQKEAGIRIFPNPVDSRMTITLNPAKEEDAEIFIYNFLGQQVMHICSNRTNISVDCNGLNTGVYSVQIFWKDSSARGSGIFIKR